MTSTTIFYTGIGSNYKEGPQKCVYTKEQFIDIFNKNKLGFNRDESSSVPTCMNWIASYFNHHPYTKLPSISSTSYKMEDLDKILEYTGAEYTEQE